MFEKNLALVATEDPVLRAKAKRIKQPQSVAGLATELLEMMRAEGGVGLAAPQVGKSIRLFVTGVDGEYQAYINPKLTGLSKETVVRTEGCLSLPRLFGEVERPERVTLQAQNPSGQTITVEADDLLARVLQHELDHLDGILFPDRMKDLSTLHRVSEEEWQTRFDGDHPEISNAEM